MQVAIDGFAASGKSTAARILAKRLNFLYVDTGAMYRAVTFEGIGRGINFSDEAAITEVAKNIELEVVQDWSTPRGFKIFISGSDVTERLFLPEVDKLVSVTAKVPQVRKILVDAQRKLAGCTNVVMAGRDIGSNVLKDAELKIFLTASPEERARRRQLELAEKGEHANFEDILKNVKMRDEIDSGRSENPLIKTPDAVEIDCTNLSIEEMVDVIEKETRKRMAAGN